MAFQLPLTLAALHLRRTGFDAIEQVEVAFEFFVDPVANRLMPHRKSDHHLTGNVTQKFVIHSTPS
ncbi:hypothetical protein D3C71_1658950 [compost metagenome]